MVEGVGVEKETGGQTGGKDRKGNSSSASLLRWTPSRKLKHETNTRAMKSLLGL